MAITVTLKTTTNGKAANEFAAKLGATDALAPFPLHNLVTTMTATINSNFASQNSLDTLPILLRMVDPDEFAKYDCITPTALDYLADYKDGVQKMEYHLDTNVDGQSCFFPPSATDNTPLLSAFSFCGLDFGSQNGTRVWSRAYQCVTRLCAATSTNASTVFGPAVACCRTRAEGYLERCVTRVLRRSRSKIKLVNRYC